MTDDTQERKHTPGPGVVIKALESAKAAVWDSHYGKGIDVGYARNVSLEIDSAIAHTVTAVNAYEPMLEALKAVEWTGVHAICPACRRREHKGHRENCIIANSLALAEGKEVAG